MAVEFYDDAKNRFLEDWNAMVVAKDSGDDDGGIDLKAVFRRLPVGVMIWTERLVDLTVVNSRISADVRAARHACVVENYPLVASVLVTLREWIPGRLSAEGQVKFAAGFREAAEQTAMAVDVLRTYLVSTGDLAD